ncbi:hypothetical protein [Prauserella sp. PE36]|uniref:hypothetical protein n=1 Tax=Prauserella sp. PE36 TaxID=1504709 RepID=UPI0013146E63|nr:hypothetical protein [Prauserella sp. PE36]
MSGYDNQLPKRVSGQLDVPARRIPRWHEPDPGTTFSNDPDTMRRVRDALVNLTTDRQR